MRYFFYTLYTFLLLSGCTMSSEEKRELLPRSSGTLAEVIVVTDAASADESYKKDIESVFSKSLEGQPPPGESMFKVIFTSEAFFKGYFKTHHNIFVFLTPESAPALKKVIDPSIIDKLVSVIQSNPNSFGVVRKDVYALNQHIFFVLAKDKAEMKKKLVDKKEEILQIAVDQELASGVKKLMGDGNLLTNDFYTQSMTERGYAVQKPASYRVAIQKEDFIWLRKVASAKELAHNIILFTAPYKKKEDLSTSNLLAVRNSFTKKYIPGPTDGSYLAYSDILKPIRTDENFKNQYSPVIRGWWDVKGDFMGGPSYLRVLVDQKNNRLVFAEGFLYYPNENKAVQLRELEILVNTLKLK